MTTLVPLDPVNAKAFEIRTFALAVRDAIADMSDVDRLSDLEAALVGARHRLKQLGEEVYEAERTRVLVVQRIGQLLGPAVTGRPRSETLGESNDPAEPLSVREREVRHDARLLAAYPEIVESAITSPKITVSRTVRLIEQSRAEERAVEAAAAMSTDTPGVDVHLGQWWALGDHRLYVGDSRDPAFIEACRAAEPVFAFADPPYNVNKAEWDNGFEWAHDWLADVAPLVAVTPGNGPALAAFLRRTEMNLRWTMAAYMTNGMTRGPLGFANWNPVCLFAAAEANLTRDAQDVIRVTIDPSTTTESAHASRKPMRLMVKLIELFSSTSDLVIDPFLGSGTTLIAADKCGRRCIGAELDPIHCGGIVARYGKEARPL